MRFLVGKRSFGLSLLFVCGSKAIPTASTAAAFLSPSSVLATPIGTTHSKTNTLVNTQIMKMTSSSDASNNDDSNNTCHTLRVLALHGSEGNSEEFSARLIPLQKALSPKVELEITSLQAPFTKGGGFAWWTMPPGIRSYTAKEYQGFEESAQKLRDAWTAAGEDKPTYDLVLGHSQGAILLASMIALGRTPYTPPMGYILNGCGYCRPFQEQVNSLKVQDAADAPRVLFVIGSNDQITPPAIQEELRDAFESGGLEVSTLKHPKGHGLPKEKDIEAIQQMVNWILEKANSQ